MADEIISRKDVAVGLIGCYQGASIIEAWLPREVAESDEFYIPIEEKTNSHSCEAYSAWNQNGRLYDFMFKKIVPFSLTDVVYYQGESDHSLAEAAIYDKEVAALVQTWRRDLQDENLHFTVVQIANHDGNPVGWKEIQEAQLRVPSLVANCDTVISADLCESHDVHPQSKRALAVRIIDTITQ